MSFKLTIDFAPAYELVNSFYAYINAKNAKNAKSGKKAPPPTLTPEFAAELEDDGLRELHRLVLLVRRCPGARTADEFITWLKELPPSAIYDNLTPWLDAFPGTLQEIRDRVVHLLEEWNRQYFAHVEPYILEALADSAVYYDNADLKSRLTEAEIVELTTMGIVFHPDSALKHVLLIPQHHIGPAALLSEEPGLLAVSYPVDVQDPASPAPDRRLSRLLKALGDDNRLRLLQFTAGGPRTFTEIVKHSGMIKSNVHYHLTALRAAGLLRLHFNGVRLEAYSLREEPLRQLGDEVMRYVKR